MRPSYYILEGQTPVPADLITWAKWFENHNNRVVAKTSVGEYDISTVFLGMDHQFGEGRPLLFETMIFGFDEDHELYDYQTRCSTWQMAEKQHKEAVNLCKLVVNP